MSALRSSLRSCVWLALAALLGGTAVPAYDAHPAGADDAACQVAGWDATRGTALAGARAPTQPPQHCVFCHWLRAVAGAHTPERVAIALPHVAALSPGPGAGLPRPIHTAPRPSRAPPVVPSI